MKWLGLFVFIFAIQPALHAQDLGGGASTASNGDQRAVYEDIEIMRELLVRRLLTNRAVMNQCAQCHNMSNDLVGLLAHNDMGGRPTVTPNFSRELPQLSDHDQDGWADLWITNQANPHAAAEITIEGAYLKGQGVIFDITLPGVSKASLDTTAAPAPTEKKSEWDQVRNQLRGENPEPAPKAKKQSLTDSLLQLVAENGKNFSHLAGNENVSIVVTFRPNPSALSFHQSMSRGTSGFRSGPGSSTASGGGAMGGGKEGASGGPGAGMAMGGGGGAGMMGSGAGLAGGGTATSSEPLTEDRELELLADLHLKRNNLTEAAAALERAVAKARSVQIDKNVPMDQAKLRISQATVRLRDLTRKLAEVYLKVGNIEAAKKALELSPLAVAMDTSHSVAKPAPAIKLPSKLILIVPASVLGRGDAVPLAEFKKLASIQVLDFDQQAQHLK
jgi:hypothetical protein